MVVFTNIKFIKFFIVLSLVVAIFYVNITKENDSKVELTLSPEQIDLAKDYASYWGIFIWTNDYCKTKGVNLNFDSIKQKYSDQIKNLNNKARNTKINSNMVVEDIVNNPMFLDGAISNQIQGMNFFRNILIAEKVAKKDINKATKIYQNLSNPEIVNQYGNLVSERDVCVEINSMIEKGSFEKNPILSNMLVFLDKY